jgi:choice-of-anchor A domain-containing protein
MKMRLYSVGTVRTLQLTSGLVIAMALLGFLGFGQAAKAQIGFSLGDAANFAIMDEGDGTNTINITGDTINGNIGIGDPSGTTTSKLVLTGDTITGNIEFAGAINDTGTSGDTIKGTISGGNTQVQTDLNYLNSLSATLGAETGTALTIKSASTITINASSGKLDASGNYVFNVTAFNGSGSTITINGNTLGHNVVINFTNAGINPDFSATTIKLTGGLTANNVLFNVASGDTLTLGGDTITGTFLDPKGAVTGTGDTLNGHVYGGGGNANSTYSGDTVKNVPVISPAG